MVALVAFLSLRFRLHSLSYAATGALRAAVGVGLIRIIALKMALSEFHVIALRLICFVEKPPHAVRRLNIFCIAKVFALFSGGFVLGCCYVFV